MISLSTPRSSALPSGTLQRHFHALVIFAASCALGHTPKTDGGRVCKLQQACLANQPIYMHVV